MKVGELAKALADIASKYGDDLDVIVYEPGDTSVGICEFIANAKTVMLCYDFGEEGEKRAITVQINVEI